MFSWVGILLRKFSRTQIETSIETSPVEIKDPIELHSFVAGAATAVSELLGRGITAEEAADLIDLSGYEGGASLILKGLDDWGVVRAANGEYPINTRMTVSEELRKYHNHSLTCPG